MQKEENLNNIYYIYFHINPLKNEIFYVGKGKGNRAYDKNKRNRFWKNIVKKYGYIVDIIEDNLTEKEAFEREIFYIKKIGRKNLGLGPLVNMTDGGDGFDRTGAILSQETKDKISESHKGLTHTEETKLKMSISKKGKVSNKKGKLSSVETKKKISDLTTGEKNPMYGRTHSEETKRKMSEAAKRRKGKKRGPYKKRNQQYERKLREDI